MSVRSLSLGPAELQQDHQGQLLLRLGGGSQRVHPVRAFPLQAPEEHIALVDEHGREAAWIARLAECHPETRALIEAALAERDLIPRIERLLHVSTFATPSVWEVQTDRGRTQFTLKIEEDIRRLPGRGRLLITSSHGLVFEVPDATQLDRHSRRLLERFL